MTQTQMLAVLPDGIPQELKAEKRWAPWRATYNTGRGKFDKLPQRADRPEWGLSTAKPDSWYSYDDAVAAYAANPNTLHGVGYVMTGSEGLVALDLDGCVSNGVLSDWAQALVNEVGSYTEYSPSGKGIRVFARAATDRDWTNHEVGLEVYAGHTARFLTVTGHHVPGTPASVNRAPVDTLANLQIVYWRGTASTDTIKTKAPDVDPTVTCPYEYLPARISAFLLDGAHGGDRSKMLFMCAIALHNAGLTSEQTFSVMSQNDFVMGVALAHRANDHGRALDYLWVEHCVKAKAKAVDAITFSDLTQGVEPNTTAEKKTKRFAFTQAAEYANDPRQLEWLVHGVLPKAQLAVIYGASTAGKTFFSIDLLMSVARGVEWRGRSVTQAAIAYVVAEGAFGFRGRLLAHAKHNEIDLTQAPLYVLGDAPSLLNPVDTKDLISALADLPPLGVIVLDTLAQTTAGGNENSSEDMGRALQSARAINKATGAMVVFIGHTGKDSAKGMRGWSGIFGALDAEIEVSRVDEQRKAKITKMKDGPGEGDEFGFALESILLDTTAKGDPITSCAVVLADVPKEKAGGPQDVDAIVADEFAALVSISPDGSVPRQLLIQAVAGQLNVKNKNRAAAAGVADSAGVLYSIDRDLLRPL